MIRKTITVKPVKTTDQLADFLTKAFTRDNFKKALTRIQVCDGYEELLKEMERLRIGDLVAN